MTHKCDMYCKWEDLDSDYVKCQNCLHNSGVQTLHRLDNREDTKFRDNNAHLRQNFKGTDDEYVQFLNHFLI